MNVFRVSLLLSLALLAPVATQAAKRSASAPGAAHPPVSAAAAEAFCDAWTSAPGDGYRFGIINFANPDMVGHTGDIPAAITAIENGPSQAPSSA